MFKENVFPLTIFIAAAAVFAFIRFTTHPSLSRAWDPNQAVLATITVDNNDVSFHNIRNTQYRSATDFTPVYNDRAFHLDELQEACLVKEVLGGMGSAHLMLEFRFGRGEWIVFSPEPRLERGERFSTLKGFFRQYELAYMVTSETDAIRERTNILDHPVYLFELRMSEANLRKLFLDVAKRETKLAQDPEFYHTLFNSVESNVVRHLKLVAARSVPGPLFFPANGDRMAFDMKLLRPDTALLTLRDRGYITAQARACQSDTEFSEAIHGRLEATSAED